MKNKFTALCRLCGKGSFLGAFLFCIVSCGISESTSEVYSKWSFSGSIINATNGNALGGATVTYLDSDGDRQEAVADDNGNFFIESLPYGTHTFTFSYASIEKKDTLLYAPKVISVGSTSESSSMEGVVASTSRIVRLCPLNAGVSGELYIIEEPTGNKVPVAKATVRLAHRDTSFVNLAPESFETSTDSLGRYSFESLPADSGLVISVSPVLRGNLRYTMADQALPRLIPGANKDLGRTILSRDTLYKESRKITASNVMDENFNGFQNISPLTTPYYVFNEKISTDNLSVSVRGDTIFYVNPSVKGDTLFLNHDIPFKPETRYTVNIVAYTKKNGERLNAVLEGDSAFTTGRGLYAVTSNAWPENEKYRSVFSIDDTLWVKFSETLSKNVERVQWHFIAKASRTISCNGSFATADAWINKDTLFVQMREKILDSRVPGDSVGMDVTVYAESGLHLEHLLIMTELEVPPSSSSVADSTASSSSGGPESSSSAATASSSSSSAAKTSSSSST